MSWRLRHQLIIFLIVTGFFAITGFVLWLIYHPRPSCNDGAKNQNELDVDCGGVCQRVCALEVSQPTVLWQKAFLLKDNSYGLAVLLDNQANRNFGLPKQDLIFRVYDENQSLLASVQTNTFLNPGEQAVVYLANQTFGERVPFRVVVDLATTSWWRVAKPKVLETEISAERFTNLPFPEVRATLTNNSLEDYRDVEVVVTLLDEFGNAFGVSKTLVDVIDPGQNKDLFFSWPAPFNLTASATPILKFYTRQNTLIASPF